MVFPHTMQTEYLFPDHADRISFQTGKVVVVVAAVVVVVVVVVVIVNVIVVVAVVVVVVVIVVVALILFQFCFVLFWGDVGKRQYLGVCERMAEL